MLRSYGRLTYDPRMKGQKVKTPFWLVLECDQDLARYYGWLLLRECCIKIRRPAWGTHISIIRGENVLHPSRWGWGDGKVVEFTYDPIVLTNERHFWLRVSCDKMLDLREWYGLPRLPRTQLHLTIGNDDLSSKDQSEEV